MDGVGAQRITVVLDVNLSTAPVHRLLLLAPKYQGMEAAAALPVILAKAPPTATAVRSMAGGKYLC